MKVVIAIDSFKGCLSSKEANEAAAEGIRRAYPDAEIVEVAVSDGGEGYMEAFHAAIGGRLEEVTVRDPLMRCIVAKYLLHNDLAVLEIAQASGLPVFLIAGRISDREDLLTAGFARVEFINPPDLPLEEAMRKEVAQQNIRKTLQISNK